MNQVATRRCQSLWKCGFRIMPLRLGAMAAAACGHGQGWAAIPRHPPAQNPSAASLGFCPAPPERPERRPAPPRPDGGGWSPMRPRGAATHLPPAKMADRKRARLPRCAPEVQRQLREDGGAGKGSLRLQLARTQDGGALKGPAPLSRGLGIKARGG